MGKNIGTFVAFGMGPETKHTAWTRTTACLNVEEEVRGQLKDTDILAAFRMVPQPGVPPEECGAAVAAESSTGTWTTVWTDGLTTLDNYKGRCYDLEAVPGEDNMVRLAFYNSV